jgi:hypothetical protein
MTNVSTDVTPGSSQVCPDVSRIGDFTPLKETLSSEILVVLTPASELGGKV